MLVHAPLQTFYEEGGGGSPAGEGSGGENGTGAGSEIARVFPMEKLDAIVGSQNPQLCKALIHLVMADSAYVENPERGGLKL